MTYCLAINTNEGLVLCSDSRTNAGFDNVSTYSKMHTFSWLGNRFITILSSGNLATTQFVLKKVRADLDNATLPNLLSVSTMHEVAEYIASISSNIQKTHLVRDSGSVNFEATFIVAGQIGSTSPETLLIYPQGNFINESNEHPYLQIGEIKYGKPILDRIITRGTNLNRAARCALVSMNSTIRSNLTVGPPVELLIYERNSLNSGRYLHMAENDAFAKQLSEAWHDGLTSALLSLPRFEWELLGQDAQQQQGH
jgi:putative proteasome-type protease